MFPLFLGGLFSAQLTCSAASATTSPAWVKAKEMVHRVEINVCLRKKLSQCSSPMIYSLLEATRFDQTCTVSAKIKGYEAIVEESHHSSTLSEATNNVP